MTQPLQLSMLMSGEEKSTTSAVRATSKSAASNPVPRKSDSLNQRERIIVLLAMNQGAWVSLPEILSLYIANYRARISELRKEGHPIELKDEWVDGQRHTAYRLVKIEKTDERRDGAAVVRVKA